MLWYYAEGGQQRGPVSQDELQRLVTAGTIPPSALVWKEGMGAWEPLSSVAGRSDIRLPDPSSVPPSPAPGLSGEARLSGSGDTASPLAEGMVMCAECNKPTPFGNTIEFERRRICAQCKPLLLQRLSEGAAMPSSTQGGLSEAELLSRDYQLDFSTAFNEATAAMKLEPVLLIVAAIVTVGAIIFLSLLGIIPILGLLIHFVVQPVLTGPLLAGAGRTFLAVLRKETADFSMVFWGFGRRFFQLALVSAIPQFGMFLVLLPIGVFMGLIMGTTSGFPGTTPTQPPMGMLAGVGALGVLAFVVIVWLSVRWMYALYLVVDKNYSAMDALRLSYKMVGKHWWLNFIAIFISGIISAFGFLGCIIGVFVTIPFASCMYATFYRQIFDRLEPKSGGY